MNKLKVLMPTLATLFLSACATSQPAAPAQTVSSVAPESIVARYMRAVNNSATANNAEVHWVNIPDEKDLARYAEKK